jgi:hypothetical protein
MRRVYVLYTRLLSWMTPSSRPAQETMPRIELGISGLQPPALPLGYMVIRNTAESNCCPFTDPWGSKPVSDHPDLMFHRLCCWGSNPGTAYHDLQFSKLLPYRSATAQYFTKTNLIYAAGSPFSHAPALLPGLLP